MRNKHNACARKVRHPTFEDALEAKRRTADMNLMVYHCGRCGGYHVGHQKGPHHTRGIYYGGRRFEKLIEAIDEAARS